MLFYFKCWFNNETNFQQLEWVTTDTLSGRGNVKVYVVNMLSTLFYIYEQVISSKKTLRICDKKKIWKIACFSTNKSVYETEHWRKSPRIVIHASRIQRMRSWQTQNHNNLVNGAYLQPFIFETVQPLIWLNAFIRLLTHRLTTEALLWIPAPHAGRWSFQIRL